MAVKIARQDKNIVLLGVPTSAAAAGRERAPGALRDAGLIGRLTEAGFTVTDQGDCITRVFGVDDEHPRARNAEQVLATLEELRPRVEVAVKSGALPIVLGGDSSIVLAVIAGARRYFRNVSLIFLDRDADLKEPATTQTGLLDGMVISHVLGRGAPELVRFWGEPPLVRAPDVALFGIGPLEEGEQQFLMRSPLRRYLAEDVMRRGGTAAAEEALDRVHGRVNEFVLHVNLAVIAPEGFGAANLGSAGGLALDQVRRALAIFARQPTLAAFVLSGYNPTLDPGGMAARQLVDLIVEILSPRIELAAAGAAEAVTRSSTGVPEGSANIAKDAPLQNAPTGDRTSEDIPGNQTSNENPPGVHTSVANPSMGTEAAGNRPEDPTTENLSRENSSIEAVLPDSGPNASMERAPSNVSHDGSSDARSPDSASPDVPAEREIP